VGVGGQRREVERFFTAQRAVGASEFEPVAVVFGNQADVDEVFPVSAAAAFASAQLVVHVQAVAGRFHQYARPAVVGQQREAQRAEIDQQAVRADVVGAHRLVVEGARVDGRDVEYGAVEHDIAADVLDAAHAQLAQQGPQVLDGKTRVTAALDIQIAVQNAVDRSGVGPRRGFPGPRRAEQVERGVGGDQLHHRGGVHRLRRVVGNQGFSGIDRLDDDGDIGGRNLRRLQRAEHVGRQAVGERRAAQDGDGQQRDKTLHAASVG